MGIPMMFFRSRQPKKGIDGHYRCRACGMLMNEVAYYCAECRKSVNRRTMKVLAVALLCTLAATLILMLRARW